MNGTCVYDGISCTSPSYWLENIGCVNASLGDSCNDDFNCNDGKCLSGKCCLEKLNCASCNDVGHCINVHK